MPNTKIMYYKRTIEISNPAFEHDHLRFVTVKSENLRGRGDICFYVPPHVEGASLPLVILLHGVYGSAWSWPLSSGVHLQVDLAIAQGLLEPMILAMPSDGLFGDGSGYVQHADRDYEQWICADVIGVAKELFGLVTESSPVFIAGLSMGGYGALRLGAKYPELFTASSGLSSITTLADFALFVQEDLDCYRHAEDLDLIGVITAHRDSLRPFRFDCGTEDLLIEQNRSLHELLLKNNIPHSYEEFSGKHDWDYWQRNIMQSLLFFNKLASPIVNHV